VGLFLRENLDLPAMSGVLTAPLFGLLTISALMKVATRIQFWKSVFFWAVSVCWPSLFHQRRMAERPIKPEAGGIR